MATPLFGAGNSTTASSASGTVLTIAKPANLADGDWLIWVAYSQSGGTTTTPVGWTQLFPITVRTGGIYARFIPTASAETASSYSITFPGVGRMAMDMFLYRGGPTSGLLDVSGTFIAQAGISPQTLTSISPLNNGDTLFEFAYYNDSVAAISTFTQDASMTMGEQVSSPTTGNTSGILIAYQTLTGSGATGTRTFATSPTGASNSGLLFALNTGVAPPKLADVSFAAIATVVASSSASRHTDAALPVTASVSADATKTAAGKGADSALTATVGLTASVTLQTHADTALTVTAAPSAGIGKTTQAAASLAVTAGLSAAVVNPVTLWMSSFMSIAHRGFDDDNVEQTLDAYTKAAAVNPSVALEISVQQTSDGIWVASHDQNTSRMFGTSVDIPTNTWATISALRTTTGGFPMAKLTDLLDTFAGRIIWVDNKNTVNIPNFLDTLDAHGGNTHLIVKGYSGSTGYADLAAARGYNTWGYFYHADVTHLATWGTHWTLLGMELDAGTSGDWATLVASGKPVLAHTTVNTAADRATAVGYGAAGVMASSAVATPHTADSSLPVTAAVAAGATVQHASSTVTAVTSTLTASATIAHTASAGLTVTGTVTASASLGPVADIALAVSSSLTAAGTVTHPASTTTELEIVASATAARETAAENMLAATVDLTADAMVGTATTADTVLALTVTFTADAQIGTEPARDIIFTATLAPRPWNGRLGNRTKNGTLNPRRWNGTLT